MSTQAKLIDEVIRLGLAVSLKEGGYRKKQRTWHKAMEKHVRVVNVQAGPAGITINLGVLFPEVRALAAQTNWPGLAVLSDLPKEYECTVRKRIGHLLPERLDKWWRVDSSTEASELATELQDAWIKYGRPWIERCSDLEEARKELGNDLTTGCVTVAAICILCKKPQEAEKAIHLALTDTTGGRSMHPDYKEDIKRWATRVGLRLPETLD